MTLRVSSCLDDRCSTTSLILGPATASGTVVKDRTSTFSVDVYRSLILETSSWRIASSIVLSVQPQSVAAFALIGLTQRWCVLSTWKSSESSSEAPWASAIFIQGGVLPSGVSHLMSAITSTLVQFRHRLIALATATHFNRTIVVGRSFYHFRQSCPSPPLQCLATSTT